MKPTLRDVAVKAGVSRTTVSYVLNGHGSVMRIPEETRRRIQDAARDLHYHPNALARSLSQQRTDTVALVMQFPAIFSGWSGFTVELMHGATDAAIQAGYDILLHTRQPENRDTEDDKITIAEEVARLCDGRVDGALLLRDRDDPLMDILEQRQFPTVLMFTHRDAPEAWFVDCDNLRGGILATEHLLSLGHQRILHLTGSERSVAARDRKQGYLQTMERAGLVPRPEWIVSTVSAISHDSPALELFDRPATERPTAVFAWSDESAVHFMGLLKQRRLRIPEDVAMVGFDSTAICEHTDPPLTSMRQPIYAMASRAFQLLVQRIRGEEPAQQQIWCPPELVIRQSCGIA